MIFAKTPPLPMRRRRHSSLTALFSLILREMSSTYGRSPGGYLWAVLDPVAGVTLLTVVFSLVLHTPPLGKNFPLFYASGYLPFMAFIELTTKIGQAIRYSRPLLSYPSISYFDALLSRLVLNLMTDILVFILLVGGIHIIFDLPADLDGARLLNGLVMLIMLVFGIGSLNCYLFSRFPLWERIWAILTRPLFFVSGVFFVPDFMTEGFRNFLMINPLTHIICELRAGIYPIYQAEFVSPLYVYAIGLIFTCFGLLLLKRHYRFLLSEGV